MELTSKQRAQLRGDDHRGVLGGVRQHARRAADHALHLLALGHQVVVHALALVVGELRGLHQVVHIQAIGLV